eukprot:CAMPEP_0194336910 /NCGR_PEP_ID=MMETSP0171-20130528/74534_1 /TAXON_ID=218684 /ORGANISM="Corethron pennatum, Strain L29A3" /LENGTH=64 /DNA_ID=CAMNT_0039100497 /DNA_START=330 /DNA_END=521 /DNA_ORIENTATION=+
MTEISSVAHASTIDATAATALSAANTTTADANTTTTSTISAFASALAPTIDAKRNLLIAEHEKW